MDKDTGGELSTLCEKLASLEAVKCGMAHEAVQRDAQTGLPIHQPCGYQRNPLCDDAIRRQRIGCGHTSARYVFGDVLDALADRGDVPENMIDGWRMRWQELDLAVSMTDHRKGDAERDLAEVIERTLALPADDHTSRQSAEEERQAIEGRIEQIIADHGRHVDDLVSLRDEILKAADPQRRAG